MGTVNSRNTPKKEEECEETRKNSNFKGFDGKQPPASQLGILSSSGTNDCIIEVSNNNTYFRQSDRHINLFNSEFVKTMNSN